MVEGDTKRIELSQIQLFSFKILIIGSKQRGMGGGVGGCTRCDVEHLDLSRLLRAGEV